MPNLFNTWFFKINFTRILDCLRLAGTSKLSFFAQTHKFLSSHGVISPSCCSIFSETCAPVIVYHWGLVASQRTSMRLLFQNSKPANDERVVWRHVSIFSYLQRASALPLFSKMHHTTYKFMLNYIIQSSTIIKLVYTRSPAIAEGPRDAGVPVEIW